MTLLSHRAAFRRQQGFSLIDVLLALGIVILISGITLSGIRRNTESNQAKAVGEQQRAVGQAFNTYISLRYSDLISHNPAVTGNGDQMPCPDGLNQCGDANDPGPRMCSWAGGGPSSQVKYCTITNETLRRNGLVPSSFSGRNAYGSNYVYQIRVNSALSPAQVDGVILTTDAYTVDGEIRYDLLGQAVLSAGADSGMIRSATNSLEGYNGTWREGVNAGNANMQYPILTSNTKLGLMGYRVGFGTSGYFAYLRADGQIPMTGNLNLDDHDIVNIKDAYAKRVIIEDDSPNNNISFGAPSSPNGVILEKVSNGGVPNWLVVRSDSGMRISTRAGAAGRFEAGDTTVSNLTTSNVIAQGTINVGGTTNAVLGGISAASNIKAGGQLQGNTLSIGTFTGSTPNVANTQIQSGAIYFNTPAAAADQKGFVFLPATATITSTSNTNMYLDGEFRSKTAVVNEVAQIGNLFIRKLTNDPVVGSSCVYNSAQSPSASNFVGTLTRAASGELVQCIFSSGTPASGIGVWRTMGVGNPETYYSANISTNTSGGTATTISCPAGYRLIDGGYEYVSGAPRAAPISSYNDGNNGWYIRTGATNAYTDSAGAYPNQATTFRARAVCIK